MTQTEASCKHRYITSQGTISLICEYVKPDAYRFSTVPV